MGRLAADGCYELVVCLDTAPDIHPILADWRPALGRRPLYGPAMTSSKSNTSTYAPASWWLGLAVGAAVSSVVTVIVVIWEWLENPGGIFRSAAGTNWRFVLDTAFSWFLPTFVYAAIIASAVHLAWSVVRKRRRNN